MNVLVATYSRTGTTARWATVAETELRRIGVHVRAVSFRPPWDPPYPVWLALSFLPRLAVPIRCPPLGLRAFDACLLCSPKWTLSCPPLNGFLKRWAPELPPTAFLLTCGGWDQGRYLRYLLGYAAHLGVPVRGGMWVRQKAVESEASRQALRRFLRTLAP